MKLTQLIAATAVAGFGSTSSAEEALNMVSTALTPTVLSGYVDTSAQWNIGTGNAGVPSYAFSEGKADGFNLNVIKLTLEKPPGMEDAWGAGYKVDLVFGPDARFLSTSSSGLDLGDAAIKQAYVALRAPVGNGLDFKLGVWDTIIGYEVFESPANPNHTRSYGYTIEPTTHTGLLLSYSFTDAFAVSAGVANTFGPTINERAFPERAESYKTYMIAAALTAPESWGFLAGSTLVGGVVNGFNSGTPDEESGSIPGNQTSWYIGTSINTPIKGLTIGAAYDYLGVSEQALRGATHASAIALYATMQLTEKLAISGRGEYARSGSTVLFGAKEVTALTGTVQYDLWRNVLTRLEFRWDHAGGRYEPYGGREFPGGRENSFLALANVVYSF
jgi:hypothetical protein